VTVDGCWQRWADIAFQFDILTRGKNNIQRWKEKTIELLNTSDSRDTTTRRQEQYSPKWATT